MDATPFNEDFVLSHWNLPNGLISGFQEIAGVIQRPRRIFFLEGGFAELAWGAILHPWRRTHGY